MSVGLTVALLASTMIGFATPKTASAANLEWSALSLPSSTGLKIHSGMLTADIVVSPDGSTIWAAHSNNASIHRSTNGGVSFSEVTTKPGGSLTAVAVSPTFAVDKTVVVASFNGTDAALWKSTNSGADFIQITGNLTSGEMFTSVALSPSYATDGVLIAATAHPTAGVFGNVYQLGKPATFGLTTVTAPHVAAPVAGTRDFYAVAISPGYAGDRTIIALGANAADTRLLVNVNWAAAWDSFLGQAAGGAFIGTQTDATLTRASLVLPSDFNGFDTAKRVAYVSTVSTASDNVSRVNFGATSSGVAGIFTDAEAEIHKLAYSGTIAAGTMFAGAHSSTAVYRVANPTASTTLANWVISDKSPSGVSNTSVAVAPDFPTSKKVFALGEGANSGFAVSTDGGAIFTEFSLINTDLNQVKDFVVSPNYNADKTIYMVTMDITADADGTMDSIWHSPDGGTTFHRYFSIDTTTNDAIVRLSPAFATDKTIIVAERSAGRIWRSTNSGVTWTQLLSSMSVINDVVVEDANTFYEAGTGTPSGQASPVATVLKSVGGADFSVVPTFSPSLSGAPFSISRAANGDLMFGTTDGRVYHSADKGLTYSALPSTSVPGIAVPAVAGANVRVIPDPAHATNKVIYAISTGVAEGAADTAGGMVQRFVVGTSTQWDTIASAVTLGPFAGIAVSNDGILYIADSSNATSVPSNGGILRSVNPAIAITGSTAPEFEFVSINDGLLMNTGSGSSNTTITFASVVVATGNATSGNTVFAIEDEQGGGVGPFRVMTYTDLFNVGPAPLTPAVTSKVPSPQVTKTDTADLTWRAITAPGFIPTYEVEVDTNNTFTAGTAVTIAFPAGDTTKTSVKLTGLEGGKQYFWRVRALTPAISKWSVTWAFTTPFEAPGALVTERTIVPAPGAIGVDVSPIFTWPPVPDSTYEFQIGEDPTFGILLYAATAPINTHAARETLAYSTTYYWRVRAVTSTAQSDWTTSIFTTMARPVPPAPPAPAPTPAPPAPAPEIVRVEVPVPIPQAIPSTLLWAVIVIGAILVVAVIVLIVRTRRVS